jgi:hypothetical protein
MVVFLVELIPAFDQFPAMEGKVIWDKVWAMFFVVP